MVSALFQAFQGRSIWRCLKLKYHIDYECAVIMLPEDNVEWNRCALIYLEDYMKRKNVNKAFVFLMEESEIKDLEDYITDCIQPLKIKRIQMDLLYRYFCLYRFFYNIIFFYLDSIGDNHSKEILNNGKISKEELICLGFYCLRGVPEK